MDLSDALSLVGLALTAVSVVYARRAAVEAKNTRLGQLAADRVADERHAEAEAAELRRTQPRPLGQIRPRNLDSEHVDLTVSNAGGVAIRWIALWSLHGRIFQVSRAVPRNYSAPFASLRLAAGGTLDPEHDPTPQVPVLLASVAEDVDGCWWDCMEGKRLDQPWPALLRERMARHGVNLTGLPDDPAEDPA